MVGSFKEYHFHLLCYWHHILAFGVEFFFILLLNFKFQEV